MESTDALRAWLAADDEPAPLVVETSGSTGTPKRVLLPRRAVLASARATEQRLGGPGPWVLALPADYVAGLMVRVRSLVAGHPARVLATDGWPPPEQRDWLVSLVPTQLLRMLEDPDPTDRDALARARVVLLGGGPVEKALRARAAEAGVRTVATYGMAETCGGCVYDGVPLDGVAVALSADGRVRLGGPTLFAGYEGEPALSAEVLDDGWFRTADAGTFDEDGRLRLLGRLDDMVVSGGVNVPGAVVAARLREHPAVRAAEVVGLDDPTWGRRVVAVVAGPLDLDEARSWVGEVHPRAWAPRQVVTVDEVPLLGNGKTDRLAVRRLAETASTPRAAAP